MNNPLLAPPRYHATPSWNFAPILRVGIDPQMSRGELPFSWYVDSDRVMWAIEHVAVRYRTSEQDVIVFEVEEKPLAYFFVSPQIGVYRSGVLMRPTAVYPAYNWFPREA